MIVMGRGGFQVVTFLLFGFLAISALIYGAYGSDSATPLMTHFDEFGKPVAWITREKFPALYLGSALMMAVAGSAVALLTPKEWIPTL